MGKTNVMHLRCAIGAGGGPEKTILLLSQYVNREEFNMVIVYIRKSKDHDFSVGERAKKLSINYHEVEDRIQIDLKSLKEIKRLLHLNDVHILHTHGFKSDFYGLFLRRAYGMKLVTTAHGWNPTTARERFFFFLDKKILRHFDSIIVVNQWQREHLMSKGIAEGRLTLIHNGIDTSEFRRNVNGDVFGQSPYFRKDYFTIGYIGRLSGEKGVKKLLKSMKLLMAHHSNLKLLIIGEGPLREYLENYSNNLGLQHSVVFTGLIADIKNVYNHLDLLVLPSETEGMPNVVLEALAMEVPVVATNVGGLPEIIDSGSNGFLVKSEDVNGLAEAIDVLIKDEKLREKFASEGRRTVCERFSFEQRMRKEENLYRQLIR